MSPFSTTLAFFIKFLIFDEIFKNFLSYIIVRRLLLDYNTNLVDFIDLINFTLHKDFLEKWRHKYSIKFIKLFQLKILDSLSKRKVIKITSLYNYLTRKCRYCPDQVLNIFETIDISIYNPLISGEISEIK